MKEDINNKVNEAEAIEYIEGQLESGYIDMSGTHDKLELKIVEQAIQEYKKNHNIKTLKAIELKDTVDMMLSEDYKDRLKAEYLQLKIRMNKLRPTIDVRGTIGDRVKLEQLYAMNSYAEKLEERLGFANIDIEQLRDMIEEA